MGRMTGMVTTGSEDEQIVVVLVVMGKKEGNSDG